MLSKDLNSDCRIFLNSKTSLSTSFGCSMYLCVSSSARSFVVSRVPLWLTFVSTRSKYPPRVRKPFGMIGRLLSINLSPCICSRLLEEADIPWFRLVRDDLLSSRLCMFFARIRICSAMRFLEFFTEVRLLISGEQPWLSKSICLRTWEAF